MRAIWVSGWHLGWFMWKNRSKALLGDISSCANLRLGSLTKKTRKRANAFWSGNRDGTAAD